MSVRRENVKRILVCIPFDLLKKIEKLRFKYRNRSELVRQALELLISMHRRKSIEREFMEGLKLLKNLNREFAEKSLLLSKERGKH